MIDALEILKFKMAKRTPIFQVSVDINVDLLRCGSKKQCPYSGSSMALTFHIPRLRASTFLKETAWHSFFTC